MSTVNALSISIPVLFLFGKCLSSLNPRYGQHKRSYAHPTSIFWRVYCNDRHDDPPRSKRCFAQQWVPFFPTVEEKKRCRPILLWSFADEERRASLKGILLWPHTQGKKFFFCSSSSSKVLKKVVFFFQKGAKLMMATGLLFECQWCVSTCKKYIWIYFCQFTGKTRCSIPLDARLITFCGPSLDFHEFLYRGGILTSLIMLDNFKAYFRQKNAVVALTTKRLLFSRI